MSSIIVPKAPIFAVTDVTPISPAIIQQFIRFLTPFIFGKESTHTSPKKNIYNPKTINTANNEKNTAVLSLKNTFKFRLTKLIIYLFPFLVIFINTSSILPLITSKDSIYSLQSSIIFILSNVFSISIITLLFSTEKL